MAEKESRERLVIGLLGQSRSGKGLAAAKIDSTIKTHYSHLSHLRISTSGILIEQLHGAPATKENLQRIGNTPDINLFIIQKASELIERSNPDVVTFDAIRMWLDYNFVRDLNGIVLYIVSNMNNLHLRTNQRLLLEGKEAMTDAEFQKFMSKETEIHIPEIGEQADATIENNGTPEEYDAKLETFVTDTLEAFTK